MRKFEHLLVYMNNKVTISFEKFPKSITGCFAALCAICLQNLPFDSVYITKQFGYLVDLVLACLADYKKCLSLWVFEDLFELL